MAPLPCLLLQGFREALLSALLNALRICECPAFLPVCTPDLHISFCWTGDHIQMLAAVLRFCGIVEAATIVAETTMYSERHVLVQVPERFQGVSKVGTMTAQPCTLCATCAETIPHHRYCSTAVWQSGHHSSSHMLCRFHQLCPLTSNQCSQAQWNAWYPHQ